MKYLLESDICIYIIKEHNEKLLRRLFQCQEGDIGISVITLCELLYGVEKSKWGKRNMMALGKFLAPFEIAAFDEDAALIYGKIRIELERQGEPIGHLDLMNAAHALALGCALITKNTREFKKIKSLPIENWAL